MGSAGIDMRENERGGAAYVHWNIDPAFIAAIKHVDGRKPGETKREKSRISRTAARETRIAAPD